MSTSSWATSAAPASLPPATTFSTPLGRNSAAISASASVRHRRRRRGLEHDRVAGGQRRADLPDRHHQRVVPGRDLADDADRLAADAGRVALDVLAGGLALQVARGAREEAQVVDHDRDLVVLEGLIGLPALAASSCGELVAVLLDRVGELQQRERALAGRGVSHPAVERARGRPPTARSTSACASRRRLGDLLARRGVEDGGRWRPRRRSTNSPSMKFCSVPAAVVLMGRRYHRVARRNSGAAKFSRWLTLG